MNQKTRIVAVLLLAAMLLTGCGASGKDRNGFNAATDKTVEIGFLRYTVPDYFQESAARGDARLFTAANNTREAWLLLNCIEMKITDEKFAARRKELLTELISELEPKDAGDPEETSAGGMTGAAMDFRGKYTGLRGKGQIVCLNRTDTRVYYALLFQADLSTYDYFPDFNRILATAELLPEPTPTPEPTPEPKSEASSGAVDPDLKAMLDEYEAFMDEYVKFMKSYSAGGANMNDMMKYLNFLTKYSDFMAKVDAVDEKKLSDADYLYYSQVMLRVSQKLLEAAG